MFSSFVYSLSRTDAIISSFSSSLQQASTPLYSDLIIQARPSSRPYKAKAVASPVKTRSSSRKEHENSVINLGSK